MKNDSAMITDQEAQTAELYCLCMESNRLERLIRDAGEKLAELIDARVVTYLDIERQQLHLVGGITRGVLNERIEAHARRCLEGADKLPQLGGHIEWIRHSEDDISSDESDQLQLLWTGAIERNGALVGVITLYATQRSLSLAESRLLRSSRTIIGESIQRLRDLEALRDEDPRGTNLDMFVVTIDPEASRGDVTGLAMSKLQDAVAKRLASQIPDAFMVAKLGINRLMVVGHPDHPLPLVQWTALCNRALVSLSERVGYQIDVQLSEGSLSNLNNVPICGLVSKPTIREQREVRESA